MTTSEIYVQEPLMLLHKVKPGYSKLLNELTGVD